MKMDKASNLLAQLYIVSMNLCGENRKHCTFIQSSMHLHACYSLCRSKVGGLKVFHFNVHMSTICNVGLSDKLMDLYKHLSSCCSCCKWVISLCSGSEFTFCILCQLKFLGRIPRLHYIAKILCDVYNHNYDVSLTTRVSFDLILYISSLNISLWSPRFRNFPGIILKNLLMVFKDYYKKISFYAMLFL